MGPLRNQSRFILVAIFDRNLGANWYPLKDSSTIGCYETINATANHLTIETLKRCFKFFFAKSRFYVRAYYSTRIVKLIPYTGVDCSTFRLSDTLMTNVSAEIRSGKWRTERNWRFRIKVYTRLHYSIADPFAFSIRVISLWIITAQHHSGVLWMDFHSVAEKQRTGNRHCQHHLRTQPCILCSGHCDMPQYAAALYIIAYIVQVIILFVQLHRLM